MGEPADPAVAALLAWARAHGAALPKLTARGRSLVLSADVAPHEARRSAPHARVRSRC
jgi:hypothetical protein